METIEIAARSESFRIFMKNALPLIQEFSTPELNTLRCILSDWEWESETVLAAFERLYRSPIKEGSRLYRLLKDLELIRNKDRRLVETAIFIAEALAIGQQ